MDPRIEKPKKGNLYYINRSDGGFNGAKGNPFRLNKDLTSLPNCVAIYGWFNEIGQKGMVYLKAPWYPYTVIEAAKKEGLEVTENPTLGGIMVWTGGKTGEGHVAGVSKIIDSNTVLTSESEYYGSDWKNFKRSKGDGNWREGCYWMNSSYEYKGCIKNPFMEEDMTKIETEALIRELVPQIIAELDSKKEKEPEDDWAHNAINMCIARGVMVGYPDGFHPQSNIRREEVAQVSENIIAVLKEYINNR